MNNLDFPISPDVAQIVAAEIGSDERIVWAAQPQPKRFALQAIPLVIFGIPWTAFAIFWMVMAGIGTAFTKGVGVASLFPLFGLPFVLIGLGMLSSPYWMMRQARRTVYVITSRRAIVFQAAMWRALTVRSFGPESLGNLQRVQRADGSGDLIFTQDWKAAGSGTGRRAVNVGFIGISDVKAVEDRIRQLRVSERMEA